MLTLIKAHKKKAIMVIGAGAYVGLGLWTGDMDWTTAATKFITIIGLGAV